MAPSSSGRLNKTLDSCFDGGSSAGFVWIGYGVFMEVEGFVVMMMIKYGDDGSLVLKEY
ncbi:hypothetical protein L195_g027240 [Trifolium pratense]|uniref:Uncharacterized protein n=1 Tax=Trifolium pratense TaxID=57577 RepID=A0A2K3KYK7_TRIPR|nr:hypothetical protein L195_g027240 [Trifolium pratense]